MSEATELRAERLSYLRDCYGLCATHINTMFNFYMVAAALVGNAYIQTLNPEWGLPKQVPLAIGAIGIVLSLVFVLIHLRSRTMIDTLETALKREEVGLFGEAKGPLTELKMPVVLLRHKFLFPAAYGLFALSFVLMAVFAMVL